MKRLMSIIRLDMLLQFRFGFYAAGLFVAVVWIALIWRIPKQSLAYLLPPFVFFGVNITTFYFVAGQLLFEKGEGTLEALAVTPVRVVDYLFSKVLTLTLLAVLENLAIVAATFGLGFGAVELVLAMVLMSVIYTLVGIIAVARYDSINEYLLPSGLFTLILQAPSLHYFDVIQSPLFYLFPLMGPLLILKSAFTPIETWQAVYGVASSLAWIAVLYFPAARSFEYMLVKSAGVRA